MEENYEIKYFSSPAYGPDSVGKPVMMKPKDERWKHTSMVALTTVIKENIENIKNFKVYEDDIFLLGFPRSGTTLLQEMIWLIVNDFDFQKAKREVTDLRFPFLELHQNIVEVHDGKNMKSTKLDEMPRPRTIKTHLPIQFLPEEIWHKKPKLIHISRDPRDVVVSWFHFTKNMWRTPAKIDEFVDEFISGRAMYCPYNEHVINFSNIEDYPQILHLTYEGVTSNIDEAIIKVSNFLGKNISDGNFLKLKHHLKFDSMKNNNACNNKPYMEKLDHKEVRDMNCFIRKGVVGGYKAELSNESIEKLDKWIEQNFYIGLNIFP